MRERASMVRHCAHNLAIRGGIEGRNVIVK